MLRDTNRVGVTGVTSNEQQQQQQELPPLIATPAQITDPDLLATLQHQQHQQQEHAYQLEQVYPAHTASEAAQRYRYTSAKATAPRTAGGASGGGGSMEQRGYVMSAAHTGGGTKERDRYDHDELRGTSRVSNADVASLWFDFVVTFLHLKPSISSIQRCPSDVNVGYCVVFSATH